MEIDLFSCDLEERFGTDSPNRNSLRLSENTGPGTQSTPVHPGEVTHFIRWVKRAAETSVSMCTLAFQKSTRGT